MTDKQKKMSELWDCEKKLIEMLHDIDQKQAIKENKKKVFSVDGFLENNKDGVFNNKQTNIILPGHYNRTVTDANNVSSSTNKFQGGSMLERIKYLESLSNKTFKKNTNNVLTFDENSVELDKLIDLVKGGTAFSPQSQIGVHTKTQSQDANNIEENAYLLSQKISNLRKELGFGWLCDTVTVYEINLKMGGDGTFTNADGVKESLPKEPLSKTCPHRRCSSILRCVVCPANYSDSTERFDTWLDFIKTKQEANKKRE